ncbi:MAG: hypothetical protein A4E49_02853 [Methanosaeta sp. PtaU1.Bin112]|nr:MAG: hypothetical protein A4E49_02853 [Methanosaeta sp. PtaU1.Bin112]
MKAIVVLLALSCLSGLAGAQIIGMGEGYSNTQLAFFNAPTTSTFEPNVQAYWGNYITSQGNTSIKSSSSNMDIWMNTFPLKFDTPQLFKATSFAPNAAAPTLTATERNSQFLTRNVNSKFGIYQVWSYPVESGSLVISNSTGTPSKDAKGQLLSQNILTLFSS